MQNVSDLFNILAAGISTGEFSLRTPDKFIQALTDYIKAKASLNNRQAKEIIVKVFASQSTPDGVVRYTDELLDLIISLQKKSVLRLIETKLDFDSSTRCKSCDKAINGRNGDVVKITIGPSNSSQIRFDLCRDCILELKDQLDSFCGELM